MSGQIIKFFPANAAQNPDMVLEQAIGVFKDVLIIGWDKDGVMDARSSELFADGGEMLWLIETFKFNLMTGQYGGEPKE